MKWLYQKFHSALSLRLVSIFLSVLVLSTAVVGTYLLTTSFSRLLTAKSEEAYSIANTFAGTVDGDHFESDLKALRKDAFYQQMKANLSASKARLNVKFLYLFSIYDNSKYVYFAEGSVPGDDPKLIKDMGQFDDNKEYEEDVPTEKTPRYIFKSGEGFYSTPYESEEYGTLISAYAPIKNSKGAVVGLVGVDLSVQQVYEDIRAMIPWTILMLLLIILPFGFIMYFATHRMLVRPLRALGKLARRVAIGETGLSAKHRSDDEIGQLFEAFGEIIKNTEDQATYASRIAAGELNFAITEKSDVAALDLSMKEVKNSLQHLVEDLQLVLESATQGRLDVRVDTTKHSGQYRVILENINHLMEAVAQPIGSAAGYIEQISKGDIPQRIPQEFSGEFRTIMDNLQICARSIKALIADIDTLSNEAANGNLSYRADASKHEGDYRQIIIGINQTLDAVIAPVQEAAAVLQEVSEGKLNTHVTGEYAGDHSLIKNTLNDTIDSLQHYINDICRIINEIADGNLNVHASGDYQGDFAPVREALRRIIQSFQSVIGDINQAAEQVANSTGQVSDASQALSQGTTEQAASIDELNESIDEIAQQTKKNADNAEQVQQLADDTITYAQQGNEKMQHMLRSMNDISVASVNISKINKVIDDIAFQTNMLALNAAVEAARAGQHGKGFSVVASEVRDLAARSASAAHEASEMIESSLAKVRQGSEIANETAIALEKILEQTNATASLISEITRASKEQASRISEVNIGVRQVSRVVQSNSASAQESAATSEELSGQAEMLKRLVGRFRLRD